MNCSICGHPCDGAKPYKSFGFTAQHIACIEWYADLRRQVERNKQHRAAKRLKKQLDKQLQMPLAGHTGPLTNTLFDQVCEPAAWYSSVPIYRVSLVRENDIRGRRPKLRSSQHAAEVLQAYLSDTDREHFVVMMLDRKNTLIGINTVSIGSLSASIVHPRETFKPAILANAAAVVLGHNHPSGDPLPSHEDKMLTKRLVEAGKLLGIDVLDHIVIGEVSYYSFADEGIL